MSPLILPVGFGRGVSGGGGGGSTLNNGVLASLALNEASGNAIDAGPNSYDFTAVNSPTQVVGGAPDGSNCRQLTRADAEHFSRNQSELRMANGNITYGIWFRPDTLSNTMGVLSHYTASGDQRGFLFWYDAGQTRMEFITYALGTTGTGQVQADVATTISVDTWYSALIWFDDDNDEIGLCVNDGTPDIETQTAIHNSTADIEIGSYQGGTNPLNGRVWNFWAWNRILTSGERTEWHNSGSGVLYPA